MTNEKLALRDDKFSRVAYLRVLEYAVNQAAGVGLQGDNETFGFSWSQIRTEPSLSDISDAWLRELIHTTCTIRDVSNQEIEQPTLADVTDTHHYVVQADEYLRFITFVELEQQSENLEIAKTSLIFAGSAMAMAGLSLIATVLTLLATLLEE